MIKKHFLLLLFLFAFLSFNSFALAQNTINEETKNRLNNEANQKFKSEKLLSDKDIDIYISLIPSLGKDNIDEKIFKQILQKANLTEQRFMFINTKIAIGIPIMQKDPKIEEVLKDLPTILKPTATEMKVLEKNKVKLFNALKIKN